VTSDKWKVTHCNYTWYTCAHTPASLELQNTITNCVDDVASWMRSNRLQLNTAKTCGLLPADVFISCRSYHSEWAPTKSCQSPSYVTSRYTSILVSPWGHTSRRLSLRVSPCCTSYEAFAGLFLDPYSSRW